MSDIQQRVAAVQVLGQSVCDAMRHVLEKEGFSDATQRIHNFDAAQFEIVTDPYDGRESIKGLWNGGHIMIYPDGMVYAEMDIIHIHPNKPKWFVEGVTAWGRDGGIKAELKLLPAL
jgi:hypothetical protein